jgi:hypothetical protein
MNFTPTKQYKAIQYLIETDMATENRRQRDRCEEMKNGVVLSS